MTDFSFQNAAGTVNFTFKTDLIGINALGGGENFTICQVDKILDLNNLNVQISRGGKYSVNDLKTFASNNSLKMIQVPGGPKVSVTTVLNAIVPAVPTVLAGTVDSATQVSLTWVKSPTAEGYSVQRATDAGFTANVVNTVVGDVAKLVVTGLVTGTQYFFKIKATQPGAADSAYTASINKTTP